MTEMNFVGEWLAAASTTYRAHIVLHERIIILIDIGSNNVSIKRFRYAEQDTGLITYLSGVLQFGKRSHANRKTSHKLQPKTERKYTTVVVNSLL